jgi:hypothetical protein
VTLNSAESLASLGGAIDLNGLGGSFTVTGTTTITGVHSGGGVDITGSTGLAVDFQGTLTATTGSTIAVNFTGNDAASSLTIGGTGNSIATTSAVAVNIATSSNVSIANATIASASNSAILGATVNDFSLTDSVVTGGAASNVLGFTGLTGNVDLLGNTISGGNNNLSVSNSSGSLDLNIADSAGNAAVIGLTSLNGNDGVLLQTSGTASLTLTVDDVDFLGARGDLLHTVAEGSSTHDITITNSSFHNAHTNTASGGGGVSIVGGGLGSNVTVDYRIQDSEFTGAVGSAIDATFVASAGTIRGLISGNTIGVDDGVGGSEGSSGGGSGISVGIDKLAGAGSLTHSVTIDNNEIRDIDGGLGAIDLHSNGGGAGNGALLEATVTNNLVEELGDNTISALYALVGGSALSGDHSVLGLDLRDNVLDASDADFGFNVIYLDQVSTDAHFNFPGYTGDTEGEGYGGTAGADLGAFFTGVNGNDFDDVPAPFNPSGVEASLITGALGDPFTLAVWP